MTDVINLDAPPPMRPVAPPKAQIMVTLEPDGQISIQSNVANLYAAVGILTSAVQGMLMAAKQPESRILRP